MSFFSFIKPKSRSRHEKAVDRHNPMVDQINAMEESIRALSDEELKGKVVKYRGKKKDEIEEHIPEIFACIREASRRTLKMRHFDVQLIGGFSLLTNSIAEMKTGEGKTLVATLPLIVHALAGKGAHLVTVNDYLSQRDAEWMRPVYEFFDLSVSVILSGQSPEEKREAYQSDITYGTNNEFGFDYLRDNMSQSAENLVQRDPYYALVDEVDSILIDEARTPLIISAPDMESTQLYQQFASLVPKLKEGEHYNIDEKRKASTLTDEGVNHVEDILGIENIYAEKGMRFVHHLEQALRAHTLFAKDKDYIVKDNQVMIVDEFTGRLMQGRRYSEGLHQALEAKEGVEVQQESKTLASITFQNFFRLYPNIAGMTGTAVTSAEEFEKVYNLDVVVVPANQKLVRDDKTDRIYVNEEEKLKALVRDIRGRQDKGQPVLVGTVAIEKSEYISALLKKEGIKHEVLNAKHHAREAEIVSVAGQRSAVTISTNMAGRGTDIKLGNGVAELGGLCILGTERHEARRIDNQLRGRSGRQGDPGVTQFYVSLEDDVMRVFGGEKIKNIMQKLRLPEDEPIENRIVSKAIESAQERVEGYYFDMRKQVLSYDDIMNRQRKAIYSLRRAILQNKKWKDPNEDAKPLEERVSELVREQSNSLVVMHTGEGDQTMWNVEEIAESIHAVTGKPLNAIHTELRGIVDDNKSERTEVAIEKLVESVEKIMQDRLKEKSEEIGEEVYGNLLQQASLRSIDTHWMEHLDAMDYLRTGIGLRGYGQRDPFVEYQKEGHKMFNQLLGTIKASFVDVVFRAEAIRQEETSGIAQHQSAGLPQGEGNTPASGDNTETAETLKNPYKGVGRNDTCPCGSGKKFKKCHGAE